MDQRLFIVDAFSHSEFAGNPAAVVILPEWPKEVWMQNVAKENNLSETAFVVKEGAEYRIRWFTPQVEVDLCGHATLAASYVLKNHYQESRLKFQFLSKSGNLSISIKEELIYMNFPIYPNFNKNTSIDPKTIVSILGKEPEEIWEGKDTIFLYKSKQDIEILNPDFHKLKELQTNRGYIALWINHAQSSSDDYEFRFFGPGLGIPEDPATGSAHCSLAPFVSERLKKNIFKSYQKSNRGAEFFIELQNERVSIGGSAVLYLQGTIKKPI